MMLRKGFRAGREKIKIKKLVSAKALWWRKALACWPESGAGRGKGSISIFFQQLYLFLTNTLMRQGDRDPFAHR